MTWRDRAPDSAFAACVRRYAGSTARLDPRFAGASLCNAVRARESKIKKREAGDPGWQRANFRCALILLAQAERADDRTITVEADALEVVEQAAALGHQAQQAAA